MKSSLHQITAIQLGISPAEAAKRCRHLPGLIFFDSAQSGSGHFSIVGAVPSEIISGDSPTDWADLRARVSSLGQSNGNRFPTGMAAGYVEYDGRFTLGIYHDLLVFEHRTESWYRIGSAEWSGSLDQEPTVSQRISEPKGHVLPSPAEFKPNLTRNEFCQLIQRAKAYIAAGDIYQVNLSHQFTSRWELDSWSLYEALRHCSAAPHAAYVNLGGRTLLSSSPELFLMMSGRRIVTKPIKGTRPRFTEPVADEQSARELIASQKEAAELVMITDLERNDLGRCCEFGSVAVTELLKMERFAQVFHLVSTIEGRLRPEINHVSALETCFPGGSITGAPKKRAMEIIAELEPVPRGVYTGAIGYFGFNGESQFNIAIRTVVIEGEKAQFHVGAGIVADSDPDLEYEETLHKAAGILMAAEVYSGPRSKGAYQKGT